MMQKALSELFILKSTKPLPIIFKGTLWQQWKQHDRCNCHVSRSTLQKCISQSANNLLRFKKAVTQTSPETAQQYIKRAVHCMTWSHLQYYHTYSAVMLVLGHGPSVPNPSPWPRLCWSQPDGICVPWILGWKWHIFAHKYCSSCRPCWTHLLWVAKVEQSSWSIPSVDGDRQHLLLVVSEWAVS